MIYDKQIKDIHNAVEMSNNAKSENGKVLDTILQQCDTDNDWLDSVLNENPLDDMVFSFSNLTAFETCPYSWYLKYIQNEEGENNIYGEFGSCCHTILEKFVKGEIQQEDLTTEYIDEFEKTVTPTPWNENAITPLFNAGFDYFNKCSMKTLHIDDCKTIGVEYKCNFKVGNNKFIGFIDLLVQDNQGDLIIIDHKSGEYPMTKSGTVKAKHEQKLESYKRQLYLYAKAVYEEFHKFPKSLVWNFFKSGDWLIIPFDENEYHDTLKWAENVIDDIYFTVDFKPNPSFFFCKNICDFRRICNGAMEESE